MSERRFRLVLSCPDAVGIIAAVTQGIAGQGGWITEAHQYADAESGWFFMRYEVRADSLGGDVQRLEAIVAPLAERFGLTWSVTDTAVARRVMLCVSRQSHCLSDLLYRWRSGELAMEIPCVVSNHEDMRGFVEWHGIPYHCIPVPADGREQAFAALESVIEEYRVDAVVLARYMQVLPGDLCDRYHGRIINIHHSFLPSFVGARPYHQAAQRGVKLIGATCHYATADLDQGPIIEQDVIRVNHHNTTDDMVRLGRDVEKSVLARGLRAHLEDRVFIHGNKTIVFG